MVNIGIVGASGVVGIEILKVLKQKNFPVGKLMLFSSKKSAGKSQETPFGKKVLEEFSLNLCEELDIIFLAVGGEFSKKYAPLLAEKGIIVIDNSSAFRYENNIPLVIPSINANSIGNSKIIANPNCTTAILNMALYPLYKEFGLKKVIVSTYQATSGAGKPGMDELIEESKNYLSEKKVKNNIFSHPIPFNLIPHIDTPQDNDYTKEEMKVTWETHKIFNDDSFPISCTAVRIPTLRAHAESVVIETKKPIDIKKVKYILKNTDGVDLKDDIRNNIYPMPLNSSKVYNVQVGRIRKNIVFGDYGLEFFICGDQLLRGAALNAVEIAEHIIEK